MLPLLKRLMPLPRLVALMAAKGDPAASGRALRRVVSVVDAVLRLRGGDLNCLERSLLLYRFLGGQERAPELRIGFVRDGPASVVGHAWVTIDGEPVAEAEHPSQRYDELLAFAADGSRLR
jgi:Transglutaminase-like superfamily